MERTSCMTRGHFDILWHFISMKQVKLIRTEVGWVQLDPDLDPIIFKQDGVSLGPILILIMMQHWGPKRPWLPFLLAHDS